MCAGLVGYGDAAEHTRDFFAAFVCAEREYRGSRVVAETAFFDPEMMVRLRRYLR